MLELELIRIHKGDDVTLGTIRFGKEIIFTLENPWKDNKPYVSCIPEGRYEAIQHLSPKFGRSFYIREVPNRTEILIHPGNREKDTKGCILLGQSVNKTREEEPFIGYSRRALASLMDFVEDRDFVLTIKSI